MTLKRDEWKKLVGQWRVSGQSAQQFAAAHGVTDTALRYWANRLVDEEDEQKLSGEQLRGRAARAANMSPALARVIRPGEAPLVHDAGRVLVMIGKASIVAEPGFDGALLRAVVRALSEVG